MANDKINDMKNTCNPPLRSESKTIRHKLPAFLDRLFLFAGFAILAILIFTSSRANIVADSVDYYAILQWLTPAEEKPIVRNLHFAEQRSPGYSLMALVPYGLLTLTVEPFVSTEKVVDVDSAPMPPPPIPQTSNDRRRPPPPIPQTGNDKRHPPFPPAGPMGSEFRLIPPKPLLIRNVPFKDFYVPQEGSWFQWKLVLSLAVTSYLFLILGMTANALMLRLRFPAFPGYAIVPLAVFSSVIFMQNVLQTPLYATLTAYGVSSLFVLFFVMASESNKTRDILLAGVFLGFMVLSRLETGVIAAALGILLLARREWRMVFGLILGSSWALIVWAAYNFAQFGTPVHLGILRGDINHLVFRAGYIIDSLVHPSSGVVFWTPLLVPGLIGLLLSRSTSLRMLGFSSLAMLTLCLLRVPIMYEHVGGGPIDIGGILVTSPQSPANMLELMRSDNNRYLIVLMPLLVLGLRECIGRVRQWCAYSPAAKSRE